MSGAVSRAGRKARTLFAVWFAHMSVYRAEIIIWMLTGTIPLIMMAVWIGKARAEGGEVGGFTPEAFAAYFLAAWIAGQLAVAWVSWELDYQIRQGILSPKLLRPLDPFWEHLAQHVTEKFVRTPFLLLIVAAGLMLVPGTRLTPDAWHLLAFLGSAALAFLIRFLIAYCIGLIAFWWDQASALDELYFTIAAFLTGSFAPLDLYPAWARAIIEWLPFPYIIYYPAQILNGTVPPTEIARVMAMQGLWIAVFAALRLMLWRRGLRRYGAVGA
jgi:ABC-2 type transport system permease protein